MRKIVSIFVVFAFLAPAVSMGAVTVKKSAAVATKKAAPMDSATSLLPTVIGLVQNVRDLKAQQEQLTAECVPTGDELRTVNDLVKEWAKVGDSTADSAVTGLGEKCSNKGDTDFSGDSGSFQSYMELNQDPNDTCYERYISSGDEGMIWANYPKASTAKVCPVGDNKNCKNISNLYDVFVKIPFSDEDFTAAELRKVKPLREKAEKCAPSKMAAAKRQLVSGFVTQTIGNVGKSSGASGTEAVIQAVSSMGGSSNIGSLLPSLNQVLPQMLDK